MINKDRILSVYTDKQTLLEYLTKIETALDKAVLTSSQLVYEVGNNYHFEFVFEDGSSIETPSITLVQPIYKVDFVANGNSVHFVFTLMDGETITTQTINLLKPVMAAAVRDGILYLALSDGTEVSAGSITASFGATTFNGDVLIHGNFHQTDGNAILCGSAEVDGNLKVNGTIEQDTYELDKNLVAVINSAAGSAGFSIYYQHARASKDKLNIVFAVKATKPLAYASTIAYYTFAIDQSIGSKLYPALGTVLDVSIKNAVQLKDDGGTANSIPANQYVSCEIFKNSNTSLSIYCYANVTADPSNNYVWRFEFNFILS